MAKAKLAIVNGKNKKYCHEYNKNTILNRIYKRKNFKN